ncbi:Pal1-domain-containing protein [Aureobasidium subglaciale]|nr:Pal1-domain-containing protein [Aureobasidium subglaciale]
MSLAPAAMAGQRAPSPGANANFASNNPFRRAASPLPSPDHRMSNNPFLDPPAQSQQRQGGSNAFTEDIFVRDALILHLASPSVRATASCLSHNPPTLHLPISRYSHLWQFGTVAFEPHRWKKSQKDLSLLDKPSSGARPAPRNTASSRSGTIPTQHRPARSQEDESRRRGPAPPRGPPRPPKDQNGLNIFAGPPKVESSRRPRRNSESSILDTKEEDRKRRERRKEREERREKEGRSHDGKSRPTKKPQGLDLIDKLDVTGIYGQGLFHHDGPFDACNPHRNRKRDVRAPMQAFPADSANNALGGSGPLNKNIDLDRFHGRGEDAFNDYSQSRVQAPAKQVQSFNPADRVEQIHTEPSYGLGTSTFLEGAPASRKDLQRRESETEPSTFPGIGLTRKKSLAHRLRGLSQNRNNITSPDGNYAPMSPNSPGQVQSAGGRARIAATTKESNPFFSDYNDAYEKKGATIRYAEETKGGRARAPSSPPRNGLTRSITADSVPVPNDVPEKSSGGGFLNRMKSLKGGRRARPERRGS